MGKIKKLSQQEIQKVAAGEVIERPANVAKELLENALDAGASDVTVYIEQGGKKSIRVIDNGFGMSPEDAHMSFVHHATGKITSIDDLDQLTTFGIRGEALSSISSISRVTMTTKEACALEGTKLVLLGGEVIAQTNAAHTTGTDITIEDLFYNVPARRKFLKTDETEWRAIYLLMQAYALNRLDCSFRLYADRKLIFNCRPCKEISERLHFFYDASALRSFMPFAGPEKAESFSFGGVMTDVQYGRYDRSQIFFFVNGRWVKNSKLTHAFLKGYAHVLPAGRYPAGVISLSVDPHEVDVNIHPRKDEVGFLHPKRIETALAASVGEKLSVYATQVLTGYGSKSGDFFEKSSSSGPGTLGELYAGVTTGADRVREPSCTVITAKTSFFDQSRFEERSSRSFEPSINEPEPAQRECSVAEQASLVPDGEERTYTLIGQLRNTYIIVETDRGVVFIDQHAAHERILYELFEQNFGENMASVPLLFPPLFVFSSQEAELFTRYHALFESCGIVIEQCDDSRYAIKRIPTVLKDCDVGEMVKQTLALTGEAGEVDDDLFKDGFYRALRCQMACKAAVKAGDRLTNEQMHELIGSFNKTKSRFSCPHGRPTSWLTTWYELEKQFKRKV